MKEYFKDLFKYNNWANQRVYDSILNMDNINEKAVELFSHIINSQKIWLSRVTNKGDNPVHPWEISPLGQCILIANQTGFDWMRFIKETSEENLSLEIVYKNSQDKEFKSKVSDILIHVINHSTYHRGQIALIVKSSGGVPAVTDHIMYKRG